MTIEPSVERLTPTQEDREEVITEIARSVMLHTEMARTDVVNPVNGSPPYSFVAFHGQRVVFSDAPYSIPSERDAGSGLAAAYAQKINDSLFDLAKRAVRAAFAQHRLAALKPPPIGGEVLGVVVPEHHSEVADLCDDCPPVGYPTDKTRCLPCPRRTDWPAEECVGGVEDAVERKPFGVAMSKEWCLRMAELEDGHEVGAGFESITPTTSGDVGKLCERLLALDDETMCFDGNATYALIHEAAARISALEKALEPSLETKVEYIGEVRETLTMRDEGGEEYSHQHTISWDATKDIMKMIRAYADSLSARALLNPTPTASTGEA